MFPPIAASSRHEHIGDISLTDINQDYTLPTVGGLLPNNYFLYSLLLQFEGRITNVSAANDPTGVTADAPFQLIDSVIVQGYHRVRGTMEQFIKMRGSTLRELNRIYSGHDPYTSANAADLSQAGDGTSDVRFSLRIPFTPLGVPLRYQIPFLLDAPNYDSLQLIVRFADDRSVFTGGNPGAFTAYGATTGKPRIRVSRQMSLAGPNMFKGYVPGRVWRYYKEITAGEIASGATEYRLFNLPAGYKLRNVLLKTGAKVTTATAPNRAFNTLNNTALTNLQIMRGLNHPIRKYSDCFALKADVGHSNGVNPNDGYHLIDFANNQQLGEALDTKGKPGEGDPDWFVQADVAALANQMCEMSVEELRNIPAGPIPGTSSGRVAVRR